MENICKIQCPILLGRTGAGKTKLVSLLSKIKPVELIACDKFYSYSFFEASVCHPKDDYKDLRVNLVGFRHPTEPLLSRDLFSDLACYTIQKVFENGNMPIVEGCSVGYITALIQNQKSFDKISFYPLIGIMLPTSIEPYSFYRDKVIHLVENGAIQEIEYAIINHWDTSYVVRKSMLVNPLYNYLKKKISYENAIELATQNFIRIAVEEECKFKTIPGVKWIEHSPGRSEEVSSLVHDIIRNAH